MLGILVIGLILAIATNCLAQPSEEPTGRITKDGKFVFDGSTGEVGPVPVEEDASEWVYPTIFSFGTPMWWLLLIVASVGIIAFEYSNKGLYATGVILFAGILMFGLGDMRVEWLWEHFLLTGMIILLYIAAGTVWGCFGRWYIFLADEMLKYQEERAEWLNNKNINDGTMPDALKVEWREYLLQPMSKWSYNTGELLEDAPGDAMNHPVRYRREIRIHPSAFNHKLRIGRWMSLWPWSMTWQFIDNVIWKVFKRIRVYCSAWMDRKSQQYFRSVEADFDPGDPLDAADLYREEQRREDAAE